MSDGGGVPERVSKEIMSKIIKTQAELDALKKVEAGEEVIIETDLRLNCILEVFGTVKIQAGLDCSRWQRRFIKAWGNSSVEAWGNSLVRAKSVQGGRRAFLF